jgi:hypothetical protein
MNLPSEGALKDMGERLSRLEQYVDSLAAHAEVHGEDAWFWSKLAAQLALARGRLDRAEALAAAVTTLMTERLSGDRGQRSS